MIHLAGSILAFFFLLFVGFILLAFIIEYWEAVLTTLGFVIGIPLILVILYAQGVFA